MSSASNRTPPGARARLTSLPRGGEGTHAVAMIDLVSDEDEPPTVTAAAAGALARIVRAQLERAQTRAAGVA